LSVDKWHKIELRTKIASGAGSDDEAELRINNVQIAISTAVAITSGAGPVSMCCGWLSSSTFTVYYDDVAVNDDQGTTENSWPVSFGVIKVFSFPTVTENWVGNLGGATGIEIMNALGSSESPNDPNPVAGSLNTTRLGKNFSNGAPYWEWTGTWENFGVPPGAIVNAVDLNYDWECGVYTTGVSSIVGPAELRDSVGTLRKTFSVSTPVTAVKAWALMDGANQAGLTDDSNTPIKLRIGVNPKTGSSSSAQVTINIDYVRVIITYTEPKIPTITLSESSLTFDGLAG
jgi:hypothetical protein